MRVLIALIILSMVSLSYLLPSASCASNWTLDITATQGAYSSVSVIGVNRAATDDFDTAYDTVVPPAPPIGVQSYLYHSSYSSSPVNLRCLSNSIVSKGNFVWAYEVQSIGASGTLHLSWNTISLYNYTLTLKDSNGAIIADMENTYSYSCTAEQDIVYTFSIVLTSDNSTDDNSNNETTVNPTPIPTVTASPHNTPSTPTSTESVSEQNSWSNDTFYGVPAYVYAILVAVLVCIASFSPLGRKLRNHFRDKRSKNFTLLLLSVLLVSCLSCFFQVQTVQAGSSASGLIYFNGFEDSAIGSNWAGVQISSACFFTQSTAHVYDGTYSAYVYTDATTGHYSYSYLTTSSMTYANWTGFFYWNSGVPTNASVEGLKFTGVGSSASNNYLNVLVYNDNGTCYFGVRRLDYAGNWATVIGNVSPDQGQWYAFNLVLTQTGYALYINDNLALSESVQLYSMNFGCFYAGNYDSISIAQSFYIDDMALYGDTSIIQPYNYVSSTSCLFYNSSYGFSYPAVENGYLYTVLSYDSNLGNVQIFQRNATTLDLVNSAMINHSLSEVYQPLYSGGYLLIPAYSTPSTYNGSLTILDATTLSEVGFISYPSFQCTALLNCIVDRIHGKILIGADYAAPYAKLLSVDLNQIDNTSAYQWITITSTATHGTETMPVIWNNTVYVSVCYGANGGVKYTELWSSTNLSNWTMVWQKTGIDPGNDYFASISASDTTLMVGYISNAKTGTTTYRFSYQNLASGVWTEYNTGVKATPCEDHCNVNELDGDSIFLVEISCRDNYMPHQWNIFNSTNGVLTNIFVNATSKGYNDRWVGLDTINNVIYASDGYFTSHTKSQVITINYSAGNLVRPAYYDGCTVLQVTADAHITVTPTIGQYSTSGNATITYTADEGYEIGSVLVDGKPISIQSHPNSYTLSMSADHDVYVTKELSTSLNLTAGWNLVSFSILPSNKDVTHIFSGVSSYQVRLWNGTTYTTPATIEAGKAYWVFVLSDESITVSGDPVDSTFLSLSAGWTMLGSVYNTTLQASDIFSDIYQLKNWSGNTYQTATTIEPDKGYWVFVTTDTQIILD